MPQISLHGTQALGNHVFVREYRGALDLFEDALELQLHIVQLLQQRVSPSTRSQQPPHLPGFAVVLNDASERFLANGKLGLRAFAVSGHVRLASLLRTLIVLHDEGKRVEQDTYNEHFHEGVEPIQLSWSRVRPVPECPAEVRRCCPVTAPIITAVIVIVLNMSCSNTKKPNRTRALSPHPCLRNNLLPGGEATARRVHF